MKRSIIYLSAFVFLCGTAAVAKVDNRPERIESAQNIIAQAESFKARAKQMHLLAQADVKEAKRLKGEARELNISVQKASLSPVQLKAAKAQFQSDLQQFAAHAQTYEAHLTSMRNTVGECQANADLYKSVVQNFAMHIQDFHVPQIGDTISPPHICGRLNMATADASTIANRIMNDQQRMAQAEIDLAKEQGKLSDSINAAPPLATQAVQEAKRQEVEQKLLAEFQRLHDEYETLQVERAALTGNGAHKTTTTHVSGKIKSK